MQPHVVKVLFETAVIFILLVSPSYCGVIDTCAGPTTDCLAALARNISAVNRFVVYGNVKFSSR